MTAQTAAVVLKKDLARSIRQGHPWIYRDALRPTVGLEHGELVDVQTRDGRRLARGFWDASSPIAVRVLESGGPGHRFADPEALVMQRLRSALELRLLRLDLSSTNAFRWVHGEGDLLPGVHVDVYAGAITVRFDGEGARAFYEPLERKLRAAASGHMSIDAVVDREARGTSAGPGTVEILENGLRFLVDVTHGQKGGLFLDQRENRRLVAGLARDKSVLNLFGYTGGFALHAAAAGAIRTDTVDLAAPAIEAARHNFQLNGFSIEHAGLHVADAFEFLSDAIERGEQWDIVISDPPSFAPRKDAIPAARHAYRRLHRLAATVVKPGGLLCAASCSSHFGKEEFLRSIETGAGDAGRRWSLDTLTGAAFDHPAIPAFPEGDYLKFAIGSIT